MLKIIFIGIFVLISLGYSNFALSQYQGNIPLIPDNSRPYTCIGDIGIECPSESINKTTWKVGTITWDRNFYLEKKLSQVQAKVIVQDFDVNTLPKDKDFITIQLWSKSNPEKINLILYESSENSGIFEDSIILSNETSNPFQNKLKVAKTDVIYASYIDATLPKKMNLTKIEVISKSIVGIEPLNGKFDYPPPKKQIEEFGFIPEDVLCNNGRKLIIKNDNSPICIKFETEIKLMNRGWEFHIPI